MTIDHGSPVEAVTVLPGGGLMVSAGGNYIKVWDVLLLLLLLLCYYYYYIKVWDVLAGAKLLTTMNHHHKTVTSLTLSRDGKFLISGSLDRQIVWTDLSLFRQVYTKHCSSSVMSVAVGGQDDYLGIGMLDGLIQIHKRKEERMEDGMIVNSRRYKKAKNHKYLQYTHYTPSIGDQVVKDNGVKNDVELKHDYLLRKFEYSKALDAVLKPYVARKKPEYTYSLLMELVRREGLTRALARRDEKQLCLLLQFLNRYFTDARFSKLCIYVSSILIDLYLPNHGFSNRVDNLFADMAKKLDREVSYIETLMELSGAVDIVLTSSHQKHNDQVSHQVEHRVCSLPT